jgi:hypothetical protein
MGSFNATCIVSGLPIEAGTKIRYLALARSAFEHDGNGHICYVGGRWQVYGVPLRGKYDDYGSVEDVEDSYTTRVFFEGLKRGAVEKGVGDNQCHDVEVRADMDQEAWLEALWEGRVSVLDARPRTGSYTPTEPQEGVPSIRRIEKVLTDAGLPIASSYGALGYTLDEPTPGFLRVRYGRYSADHQGLEKALPAIHAAGYAAMVTVGTGSYANPSEILVAPLPPTDPNTYIHVAGLAPKESSYDPRPVSQAMIREDVWEILRSMTVNNWDKPITSESMRQLALEAVDEELEQRARKKAIEDLPPDQQILNLRKAMDHLELESRGSFRYYLGAHEGLSGFTFGAAFQLGLSMTEDPEEMKAFAVDLADTVFVQWAYSTLHGQWHPTSNAGQEGNWKQHRAFLQKLAEIKGAWEDEEDAEE